ncbi:MAG TPA: peptidoglycan DD-metalloendopeptidase family protein [Xanthobacteraceae bacterium]|jgi:murein DD-endopeptidase MepM/ murein hydrolase activator NlpD
MTRSPDQLQNLADALGEDVVAASPEVLAAEAAQERGDGAGLALDFDRIVVRAERQARWRRVAQWLRARLPSASARSWRPALAAVAGVAVVVVAGDIYLNVRPDRASRALQPVEQSRAREPARDEVASRPQVYGEADTPAVAGASPTPAPPIAASADAPRRVRTVPIRPATGSAGPPLAQSAPGAIDARSLAPALSRRSAAAVQPPSASRRLPDSRVAVAPAPTGADQGSKNRDAVPSFAWPVSGPVMADVAGVARADKRDAGIDIAVPLGTDVLAAADGVITYAGDGNRGSGNLILVRHDGGFVTAYAHVDKILVKVNDRVQRGDAIATSGGSGTAAPPLLHFEIRKGEVAVDARQYLPR